MKNECSIVGDLLALYQDGLVSENTAAFVEEHLARCAVCRARLEQLRAPAAPQEAAQEERAFLTFAARWKKKRRRVLAAFAALALAAALLAACLFSAAAFGTANFVSAGWGLARVALLNEPWTEVASGPKVVLAAPDAALTDYMAWRGFAENEQERMGALRVFEKDGAKEYVLCRANRWFARWIWQ